MIRKLKTLLFLSAFSLTLIGALSSFESNSFLAMPTDTPPTDTGSDTGSDTDSVKGELKELDCSKTVYCGPNKVPYSNTGKRKDCSGDSGSCKRSQQENCNAEEPRCP